MEQKEQTMTDVPPEPDDSPDTEPGAQPESEPDVTGDPETVIDPGSDAVDTESS